MNQQHFGIIGYPLGHTFSPQFFRKKFQEEGSIGCTYKVFPISDVEGYHHIDKSDISGFNVTIPYKETIMPFLDEIDSEAQEIGAVNTIWIHQGKSIGYNTDVYGFENSLKPLLREHHKKALILGNGGAAKALKYVLKKLDIDFSIVSRKNKDFNYNKINAGIIEEHKIIINTTPLGMAPYNKKQPNLPYQLISSDHLLYDLIYNPEKTLFLKHGERQGATIKNGHEMLILQAEKSWEIWNQINSVTND
jgi:shikimate dehydrogenase